ncbi:phytoene desaturase [Aquirufa rosea]|uniref:Phytoene desaturase n=2 Tax=Aquirufa rosea TaxID=2509241 RepID=A0A4Q1BYV3_9BACT|nr:phytoene desaturase [Aquirufa rosea]
MKKQIGIVGSGVASLAMGIRMACLGHQVDIFEANAFPGGKLSEFEIEGYRFDAGPSLFTLPHLVDELFTLAQKNPRDYFNYTRLPEICRYFWEDQTRLTTYQNPADTAHEIAQNLGENEKKVHDFILGLQDKYQIISELFLENSLHQPSTWLGKKAWRGYLNIPRLGLFSSMHQYHKSTFKNPKTVQLFDRYATYNGSDPYQTPATLSIIPHLEYNLGAYFPRGGMIAITQSLHQLAVDLGVRFRFNEKVTRIICKNQQAIGLETAKGQYPFDAVVSNMDIRPSYQKLLQDQIQPKRLLQQEQSSSGIIFYWGMNKSWDELGVHNIFFSDHYQEEFKAIFTDKTLHEDPTVYVHISSKVAPEDAPKGGENWFILINCPSNIGQNWDELVSLTRERVIQKISRVLGQDIRPYIIAEDYLDPRRIENRTSSAGGALYGNASNNRFAAFLRHPNYRQSIKNLYWVGGSVHPGGGIPLCLSSAKIAAKLFQENA